MLVFWVATPCGLVGRYQRFGGTYCPSSGPNPKNTIVKIIFIHQLFPTFLLIRETAVIFSQVYVLSNITFTKKITLTLILNTVLFLFIRLSETDP
jgi:hypothetical protein